MILGLLPALGGSLSALHATGQLARVADYDLQAAIRTWDDVRYFSYVRSDAGLAPSGVVVVPGPPLHRWLAQAAIGFHSEVSDCDVLRVMHFTGVLPAAIAKRRYGMKVVVQYGYDHEAVAVAVGASEIKRRLLRLLWSVALRTADGVIATTTGLERRIREGGYRGYTAIIPNGVDLTAFAPAGNRSMRHLLTKDRCVLYAGRVSPEKNLSRLRTAAVRAGVARLEIVSGRPYTEMPVVYQGADAFALVSLTEGSPKALFEAMASGLPCVVSDRVEDVDAVIRVDPDDEASIATGLRRALKDTGDLGKAARIEAEQKHEIWSLLQREQDFVRWIARWT